VNTAEEKFHATKVAIDTKLHELIQLKMAEERTPRSVCRWKTTSVPPERQQEGFFL